MELIFYISLFGVFSLMIAVPASGFALLGMEYQREFKPFIRLAIVIIIWLGAFIFYDQIVPDGELSGRQYSGKAGVAQLLFAFANFALLVQSIKALRLLMNNSRKSR